MISKFLKEGNFKNLLSSVENGDSCSVFNLNIGEKLSLVENSDFLFFVCENNEKVIEVSDKLIRLGRKVSNITDTYDIFTSEFNNSSDILKILFDIKNCKIDTVVLTPEVLTSCFPDINNIKFYQIKKGDEIDITKLTKYLVDCSYKRVDLVSNEGEFAVRGDILDIFPYGEKPTRIYFEFDVVDSIKLYNSVTMLTTEEIDSISFYNSKFINIDEYTINNFFTINKINKDSLFDDFCKFNKNDYRLIAFDSNITKHIFDFVDTKTIVFDGAKTIYDKVDKYIKDFNESIKNSDNSLKIIYKNQIKDISKIFKFDNNSTLLAFHYIQQNNRIFKPKKVYSIRTLPPVNYKSYNDALILDLKNFIKQNYTIILPVGDKENALKYKNLLESQSINCNIYPMMSMCLKNNVNIVSKNYPLDIILPEDKLAIISSDNLIGKKKKIVDFKNTFADGEVPNEGDFVVHNLHGIGKCLGVKTLQISNALRDYVVVQYKNNDKFYLPVENLNELSKYLGSDKEPKLNKIGGVEFEKTKSKIKSAVKKIAFNLIKLYRERLNLKGYKYSEDDSMQKQFEDEFGFVETLDQLKAISDCKMDMQSGKVMDRLVCGDVGFGKTEVALRIAFKTILNGKQVALLCPTTILSEQHLITAKNRMANFGVRIEVLNRLKSRKEIEKIKNDFSCGKIDMLCGTHKLLSSDIDYRNLGLLILDEEQKFGVADKEKIKNFKNVINVLTLSATPIPRTLNMSLIGVRDISVIETPPVQRLSSDVVVSEYNNNLLVDAINKELARNGQVLIIYNRVESIYDFASRVKMLLGNVEISVAHGQMNAIELENEILKLYSGETKILISTTLIENGVDLPNANTLIVINSDKLGLSQLYQLKGRIGRSNKKAYAYFTFDSRKILSENAYKRLQAIKEFSEMGSGFKIAMRDLEIRGAGSLLGLEQSGHIEKIGYNMYVKLLNESVHELNGEEIVKLSNIKIETNISAYLSHLFNPSAQSRMSMYKQIADIKSKEDYERFISYTQEICGDLPDELINLCKISLIKNLYSLLGVFKISIKEKTKIFFENKEYLTKAILDNIDINDLNLDLSKEPVIEINNISKNNILDFLIAFAEFVNKKC